MHPVKTENLYCTRLGTEKLYCAQILQNVKICICISANNVIDINIKTEKNIYLYTHSYKKTIWVQTLCGHTSNVVFFPPPGWGLVL